MTSTLRVKSAGVWRGPVSDGILRVKSGGVWVSPSYVRAKAPSGAWVDSQYRGYPNPPSAPWVHAWSYSNCQVAWNYAAGGGAAISYYEVVITDAAGNWLATENSTDNISPNWGVGQDTRYQFYVRSVAANGLVSAWQGPLRVGIGHPSTPNYGWVQRTRDWYSQINGNWIKDKYAGGEGGTVVFVPNSVLITALHYNIFTNNGFSSVISPWNNRTVSSIYAGIDQGNVFQANNPLQTIDYGYANWGADNYWGFICRGAGWTVSEGGTARLVGQFGVQGTEYYNNWEIVSYNPEQGNYYW
jgi:hypothetical protein